MVAKRRGDKVTPKKDWRPVFLDALLESGNVSASASAASIARQVAYRRRDQDADFREAWDAAMEEACDSMEAEARRRAVDGVQEPVYYQGEIVGAIQKYSDTLLIFMLKGHRPERFGDKLRVEHAVKEHIKALAEQHGVTEGEVMAEVESILHGDNAR